MVNKLLTLIGFLLIGYGFSATAWAQSSSSTNYRLEEQFIGSGGTVESSSASYKESSTAGDVGVGETLSATYRAQTGFNTTDDPRLVMIVNTSSINFGQLSTAAVTTATSTFSVLNYTAHGYAVFTIGNPPTNSGYSLTGMTGAGSSPGTEQYGINLVNNASPNIGVDPVQVPSGSFSFGDASSGYDSADSFRYVAGEQIAESLQTSGETDYTISYIVNAATTTPGGQYQGSQSLVVVGTY